MYVNSSVNIFDVANNSSTYAGNVLGLPESNKQPISLWYRSVACPKCCNISDFKRFVILSKI